MFPDCSHRSGTTPLLSALTRHLSQIERFESRTVQSARKPGAHPHPGPARDRCGEIVSNPLKPIASRRTAASLGSSSCQRARILRCNTTPLRGELKLKTPTHSKMKPQSTLKWLAVVGTSTLLALVTASAEPDKDKKDKKDKDQPDRVENKSDKHAGNKADKRADKADEKARKDFDKADNKADKAERKADQADARSDRKADQAENRQERRVYKKGEFKERFQRHDNDRVVTYFSTYKDREHGVPPDIYRKWHDGRRLPSGWRDRLVTGYVIEDSWLPSFEPVPYSWFPQITVVPDTRLYWYGDRVVRVYEPTREVVDVVVIPTIHIDL